MNLKLLRFVPFIVVISLSTVAFAQSHAHEAAEKPAPSEAQKAFDTLKTLAGEWEGPVSLVPGVPEMNDKPFHLSLRVTSRGNAIVHELQEADTPLDPTKYDHPVTMLYVDSDKLNLIHYCDAGNRPHMVGTISPDGKTVEFEFVDISGSLKHGHMHHALFTMIDASHHAEDWTYILPGDKPMHAHFDLHRVS
jgi:hypothetical protein